MFPLCVYQLKGLGIGGMLLMWERVRVDLISSVCFSSEGGMTWECYCECVRVELVSSVCLSAEEPGEKVGYC